MREKLIQYKKYITYIGIGLVAVSALILSVFSVKKTPLVENAPVETPSDLPEETRKYNYVRPVSSLKEIQEEEEEEFEPAPDQLNLAYFFPEDADTSDSIHTYAGEIFTDLTTQNADFFATYYDLSDTTPIQMAARQGLGAERVMGQYNKNDSKHDPNNPSSWTVNSFKNINVSFYDGDGKRITGYYNVQEIMSLASVYSYFHDMEDAETMKEYCSTLFKNSVSAKVSMGSVYYCSGCLDKTIEQEANEAIALENELDSQNGLTVSDNKTYIDGVLQPTLISYETSADSNAEIEATVGYVVANRDLTATQPGTKASGSDTVVSSGSNVSETTAGAAANESQTAGQGTTAVSTEAPANENANNNTAQNTASSDVVTNSGTDSGSITAPAQSQKKKSVDDQVVVSGGTASQPSTTAAPETAAASDVPPAESIAEVRESSTYQYYNGAKKNLDDQVVVSGATNTVAATTAASEEAVVSDVSENTVSKTPADQTETAAAVQSETSGTETSQGDTSESSISNTTASNNESTAVGSNTQTATTTTQTETITESYCPGHIDLYVSITIRGIDQKNGLFKVDSIGNNKDNFNEKWQGWTEEMINYAKTLNSQNWFDKYGLSISSIRVNSPLTDEEIQNYLDTLPADVSDTRKAVVEFALKSVGKVPYYWGGKPSGPGYEANNFHVLTSPDYRGRILKGLDCSGWINWVYWSATGSPLAGESTGSLIGCGRRISRSELKPGDIIIRTGADSHVVMFLCWAQNGNFIGIHETGGAKNNVVVNEMTASWPYYRALVE